MRDVRKTAKLLAKELGILQREIQVCSTGIIGMELPMDRIEPNIPKLVKALNQESCDVAQAIMTSDTKAEREWLLNSRLVAK